MEYVIKQTFGKRFVILFNIDFFKHPLYPYGLEDLIVRLELNSPEKMILCSEDSAATYKLSDISLEYDATFDDSYAATIGELYAGSTSIPYTQVKSVYYQTLSKTDTTWKIDVYNLSVRSLKGSLVLFLDERDDFANKNEEICNSNIKQFLIITNGMPHQLLAEGLQIRDICPELKKYFYKEHSNMT